MQRLSLVLLLLSVVPATGCLISRVSTWDRVTGRSWDLVLIEGDAPLPESRITIRLEDPTQLFGESGVNRYFGSYEQVGKDGFRASPIAGTRMAGPPELMEQETRYLELLQRADRVRYRKTDDGVTLEFLAEESALLTFSPGW